MNFNQLKISLTSIGFGLLLTACDTPKTNVLAQEQNFVCKSLIDGYLKAQHLGEYQLDQIEPSLDQSSDQRNYRYKVSGDHTIKLNMPQQGKLEFECNQMSAQRFNIELKNQKLNQAYPLMSIDLPHEQTVKQLTAYSVNRP